MTVIFVAQGNRRSESECGLATLGVGYTDQLYLGLPDGQLWAYEDEITEQIIATVLAHNITSLYSLGPDGYDLHPDHITTHLAAEAAVKVLGSRYDRNLGLLALSSTYRGDHLLVSDSALRQRKLGALAAHPSQFPIAWANDESITPDMLVIDGFAISSSFWDSFRQYHPLVLDGESYATAQPRSV